MEGKKDFAVSDGTSPIPPRAESEGIDVSNGHIEPPARPKEDFFAWLQVLGAFCLNLNTWSAKPPFTSGPICRSTQVRVQVC